MYQFIKFQKGENIIFCFSITKGCDYGKIVESLTKYNFNGEKHTYLIGDQNFDSAVKNDLSIYLSRFNFVQKVMTATQLGNLSFDLVIKYVYIISSSNPTE